MAVLLTKYLGNIVEQPAIVPLIQDGIFALQAVGAYWFRERLGDGSVYSSVQSVRTYRSNDTMTITPMTGERMVAHLLFWESRTCTRVASVGTYTPAPASSEAIYSPATFGRTAADRVFVAQGTAWITVEHYADHLSIQSDP